MGWGGAKWGGAGWDEATSATQPAVHPMLSTPCCPPHAVHPMLSTPCCPPLAQGMLDDEHMQSLIGPEACVVALHACTEANSVAVAMAESLGARWVLSDSRAVQLPTTEGHSITPSPRDSRAVQLPTTEGYSITPSPRDSRAVQPPTLEGRGVTPRLPRDSSR